VETSLPARSVATVDARRVLPQPPAPVSVSRRVVPSRRLDLGDLFLPPDETGERDGQVGEQRLGRRTLAAWDLICS